MANVTTGWPRGRPRPFQGRRRALPALRERRLELGLSNAELARRVGMNPPFLGCVERGSSLPSPDLQRRIAAALGCAVDEVFAPELLFLKAAVEQGFGAAETLRAAVRNGELTPAGGGTGYPFEFDREQLVAWKQLRLVRAWRQCGRCERWYTCRATEPHVRCWKCRRLDEPSVAERGMQRMGVASMGSGCGHAACSDPACTIMAGQCHCGCGEPARLAKKDRPEAGIRAGAPLLYANKQHAAVGRAALDRRQLASACERHGWLTLEQLAEQLRISKQALAAHAIRAGVGGKLPLTARRAWTFDREEAAELQRRINSSKISRMMRAQWYQATENRRAAHALLRRCHGDARRSWQGRWKLQEVAAEGRRAKGRAEALEVGRRALELLERNPSAQTNRAVRRVLLEQLVREFIGALPEDARSPAYRRLREKLRRRLLRARGELGLRGVMLDTLVR